MLDIKAKYFMATYSTWKLTINKVPYYKPKSNTGPKFQLKVHERNIPKEQ